MFLGVCVCVPVLPQVDGADVPLDAGSSTQHLATVLPQALEHHLHGVLEETQSAAATVRNTHTHGFMLKHVVVFMFGCRSHIISENHSQSSPFVTVEDVSALICHRHHRHFQSVQIN